MSLTRKESLRRVAYHEAGHAVAAHLAGRKVLGASIARTEEYRGIVRQSSLRNFHPDSDYIERITPRTISLSPATDPWRHVLSKNLHRRHLTTAQRLAVLQALPRHLIQQIEDEAQARKQSGQKDGGPAGGRGHKKPSGRQRPQGLSAAELPSTVTPGHAPVVELAAGQAAHRVEGPYT